MVFIVDWRDNWNMWAVGKNLSTDCTDFSRNWERRKKQNAFSSIHTTFNFSIRIFIWFFVHILVAAIYLRTTVHSERSECVFTGVAVWWFCSRTYIHGLFVWSDSVWVFSFVFYQILAIAQSRSHVQRRRGEVTSLWQIDCRLLNNSGTLATRQSTLFATSLTHNSMEVFSLLVRLVSAMEMCINYSKVLGSLKQLKLRDEFMDACDALRKNHQERVKSEVYSKLKFKLWLTTSLNCWHIENSWKRRSTLRYRDSQCSSKM